MSQLDDSLVQDEVIPMNELLGMVGAEDPNKKPVVIPPEDIKEMEKYQKEQAERAMEPMDDELGRPTTPQIQNATEGLALGVGRMLQRMYNGAAELANYVGARANGANPSADTDPLARLDLSPLRVSKDEPMETRVASLLVEYGAPVAAGMATGAGALPSIAAGMGIDFLTMDPHQERLSTMVNESYPELRNMAVAGPMLSWMAENNPEMETELEGRLKNMLEGAGIGSAIAGVFTGVTKMSAAARAYQASKAAAPAVAPAVEVATDAASVIKQSENAIIEAKILANEETSRVIPKMREPTEQEARSLKILGERAAEGDADAATAMQKINEGRLIEEPIPDFLNPDTIIKNVDGGTRINPYSESWNNFLPDGVNAPTRTWDDYRYNARLMGMTGESETMAAGIIKKVKEGGVINADEQVFLRREILPPLNQEEARVKEALFAAMDKGDGTEEMLLIVQHDQINSLVQRMVNLDKAAGTQQGQALQSRQMIMGIAESQHLVDSYKRVKALRESGEATGANATKIADNEAKIAAIEGRMKEVDGAETKLERTKVLPAQTYYKLQDEKFRKELAQHLQQMWGGEKGTKAYSQSLRTFDDYVKKLPQGEAEAMMEQYNRALQTTKGDKFAHIMTSMARKFMLSSLRSATSAFMGNTLTMVTSVVDNYAAAGARQAGGMWANRKFAEIDPQAAEMFAQANDYAAALFSGFGGWMKAIAQRGDPVINGIPMNRFKKLELRGAASSPAALGVNPTSLMGKSLEAGGWVVDVSPLGWGDKLLGKADMFYGATIQHAELTKEAMAKARMAVKQGIIRNNKEEMKAFTRAQIMLASVEEVQRADEVAKTAVFSNDLPVIHDPNVRQDLRNVVAEGVEYLQKGPVRKFLWPFLRTGYNMMDYAIQHSPIDPLVWSRSKYFGAMKAGGDEAAKAWAKVGTGSAVTGMAAYLYTQGQITGPPPTNPRMMRALQESNKGWQPYSIKIGDTYIDYRPLAPLAQMLRLGSMIGIISDGLDERDVQSTMILAGSAVADAFDPGAITNEFGSFTTLLEKMAAPEKDGFKNSESIRQFIAEQVGKYSPAIIRDAKQEADPFKRDVTVDAAARADGDNRRMMFGEDVFMAIKNTFSARTPWLSDDMAVQRNFWGEPLFEAVRPGPDFLIPLAASMGAEGSKVKEVLEKLARSEVGMPEDKQFVKVNLSMPSRTLQIEGIALEMTNEDYEKYMLYYAGYQPDESVVPGKEKPISEGNTMKDHVSRVALETYELLKNEREVPPKVYNYFVNRITASMKERRKFAKQMMLADPKFNERFNKASLRMLEKRDVRL